MHYLIIAFQVFCVYHAIKNRNNYYWLFLIIFLPLVGCIIYLITQVYNKRDAENIQKEITSILVPTKKVKDLQKQIEFSDTYQNRVNLADAYFEMNDFKNAIVNYEVALNDNHQNNFDLIKQLATSYFKIQDYQTSISYSKRIKKHNEFKRSRAQFIYGLSLEKMGQLDEAENELKQIDLRYSNYEERLVLSKFLLKRGKKAEARYLLKEIKTEANYMTKPNKRLYRATIIEVEKLLKTL